MADTVRVRLLGGFDATAGGRLIPSGGWRLRKSKSLVKLLALEPTHTLHVDAVIDALWPDLSADAGRNNLHQVVYAARRALSTLGVDGSSLLTLYDDMLALGREGGVVTDLEELRSAVREAKESDDVAALVAAVRDSAGELLPEDGYEPWLQPHAAAFKEWRTKLVMEVVETQIANGDSESAVVLLAPVIAADPMHEPAVRAHMRALAASGRRSEALISYERLRTLLRDELGADPEPATRAVFRELLTGVSAPAPAVVVPAQRGRGSNLPAPMTTLVGRDRELTETQAILARTRLLTLTGMGGAGKSVLALELARRSAADFAGNAHLVELGALSDGRQVALQVARSLRLELPTDESPVASMAAQIGDRPMLLVVDNCEHLIDATAQVVSELLRGCAGLRIIATSREALRVEGEVAWRTPSLALPDPDGDLDEDDLARVASVELFVGRAAAALPGFRLGADNAAAVAQICYRLDGIPLALELAAACIPMMSPQQVADRLGDSLALLRRGDRAAITRQQTLEATLTWSHDLLGPAERTLFRRLAVFAGSFTLDAVEGVCYEGLDASAGWSALMRLVDTSLVVVDSREDVVRYRLLDTVRQYASHQLRAAGEQDVTQRRHCHWYLEFARDRDPDGQPVTTVLPSSIDVEHDNLRVALRHALVREPVVALELATSLWRYWLVRGYFREGRAWLEAALEAAPQPSALRARALIALAVFDVRRAVEDRLEALGREAVTIQRGLGDTAGLAAALRADAVLAYMRGAWDACWERTLELAQTAPELPEFAAVARHLQAVLLLSRGDLPAARKAFGEALLLLEAVPRDAAAFISPLQLGFAVQLSSGAPRLYFEETVLHGRLVGVDLASGYLLNNLADLARLDNKLDEALQLLHDARDRFVHAGDMEGEAYIAGRIGCAHRHRGEYEAARDELTRCLDLRRRIGDRRGIGLTHAGLGVLAACEGDLATGRALIDDARRTSADIHDGAAQVGLSITLASALADGDPEQAERLLREALVDSHRVSGNHRATAWGHALHADVLTRLDRHDEASYVVVEATRLFVALGAVDGPEYLARWNNSLQSRR